LKIQEIQNLVKRFVDEGKLILVPGNKKNATRITSPIITHVPLVPPGQPPETTSKGLA
jgi:hypothetical protein